MRIEVLCTGDELLTGVTADTNTPYFAARLLRLGEVLSRTTVVGDDRGAISAALKETAARAQVVLVSGGLGPTADDVTVDAVSDAFGVGVEEHGPTLARIRERLLRRGLTLSPENARQARVPAGADVAPNPVGAAPFFELRAADARLFFVPGVPREYRALIDAEVLPRISALKEARGERSRRAFRILRTLGIPESELGRRMAPIAAAHPAVRVGFRTELPENHVELHAAADSDDAARAALSAAEAACAQELGSALYGRDEQTLPSVVAALLREKGQTVSFAESCTGGLIAALLTEVPGASDVFVGAAVTYGERLKLEWAGVQPASLQEAGAVSAPVAEQMARGLRERAGTTWAVSVTGFAGPGGGTERDPVGTVYIATCGPDGAACERHVFIGDRARIRAFAAATALDALRLRLLREGQP